MCRSILSITERAVRVEVGGDREVGEGVGQNLKKDYDLFTTTFQLLCAFTKFEDYTLNVLVYVHSKKLLTKIF